MGECHKSGDSHGPRGRGNKDYGRSLKGGIARRIKTPNLYLSQRNLKIPAFKFSAVSVLLSKMMVKTNTRGKIIQNTLLQPVLSPSLSLPWNILGQIKSLSRHFLGRKKKSLKNLLELHEEIDKLVIVMGNFNTLQFFVDQVDQENNYEQAKCNEHTQNLIFDY